MIRIPETVKEIVETAAWITTMTWSTFEAIAHGFSERQAVGRRMSKA
jgi:phage gp29-like protein